MISNNNYIYLLDKWTAFHFEFVGAVMNFVHRQISDMFLGSFSDFHYRLVCFNAVLAEGLKITTKQY